MTGSHEAMDSSSSVISPEKNGYIEDPRLGRRLAYLLRYGAEKEGLQVQESGFVPLMALLKVPLLTDYQPYHILRMVDNSCSNGKIRRFERKFYNGEVYVRALYGRRMERNPNHSGTCVARLLECCLNTICSSITDYDLENFPDEFLLNTMIHRLKQKKRLNNRAFKVILGPTIEHLDLGAVYLTENTLRLVSCRCPHLKVLNLRESGYLLNDHIMEVLLKKLPELESLNLAGCRHLTDRTLFALSKHCRQLQSINLSNVPLVSQEGVLRLVTMCTSLTHLDLIDNQSITGEGREVLAHIAEQRKMMVLLQGQQLGISGDKQNASLTLPLASIGKYW